MSWNKYCRGLEYRRYQEVLHTMRKEKIDKLRFKSEHTVTMRRRKEAG